MVSEARVEDHVAAGRTPLSDALPLLGSRRFVTYLLVSIEGRAEPGWTCTPSARPSLSTWRSTGVNC